MKILLLNKSWVALRVISVRRAFALVYVGAAHVLDVDGTQWSFSSWVERGAMQDSQVPIPTIKTRRGEIEIPHTIILQRKSQPPPQRVQRFSRQNVYIRDGYQCQYCNGVYDVDNLNLDHVIPRSQGGVVSWENIVCSCKPCNRKKGGRTPKQASMTLKSKPVAPRWTPFSGVSRVSFRPEWRVFAGNYFSDETDETRLAG